METRAHHVLIGAFALLVVALAAGFALWLGKGAIDREWNVLRVVFQESVTGLSVGSAVQYNGIQVGEVRRLELDPEDTRKVWATVRVDAAVPVRRDTEARLAFTGLTGVAIIQLSGGSREAPLLRGTESAPASIVASPSAIARLLSSSEDLASTGSELLVRLKRLLSDENVLHVSQTLEHLATVSATLARSEQDLGRMLAQLAKASQRLSGLLDAAEGSLRRMDEGLGRAERQLSRDWPRLVAQIEDSLAAVQEAGNQAAGLLGENRAALSDFSQQGLGQLAPALAELRATLETWRRLGARLEEDPSGLVLRRGQLPEYEP